VLCSSARLLYSSASLLHTGPNLLPGASLLCSSPDLLPTTDLLCSRSMLRASVLQENKVSSRTCTASAMLPDQRLLQLKRTTRTFVLAGNSVPVELLRDTFWFEQLSRFHRPEHDQIVFGFFVASIRCC
jgi:hypothetical protein